MNLDVLKNENDDVLTVAITGSIDTVTAPELEDFLSGIYETTKTLVLDFSAVDYVSSAGLRVIMAAEQRMSDFGEMILKNVNEDVKEVLEMTGFDELLHIE